MSLNDLFGIVFVGVVVGCAVTAVALSTVLLHVRHTSRNERDARSRERLLRRQISSLKASLAAAELNEQALRRRLEEVSDGRSSHGKPHGTH